MSTLSAIAAAITPEVLRSDIPMFKGHDNPLTVTNRGSTGRSRTYKVDTTKGGKEVAYFMKVTSGEHGKRALEGEYISAKTIHDITPNFIPEPFTWGSFKAIHDAHYFISKFHKLVEDLEEHEFCKNLATLHTRGKRLDGRFGFDNVTYKGDLPQENGYTHTWEAFFMNGFKHMLSLNVERGGPWDEMEILKQDMLDKVIPRLLKPMEVDGRSIKPVLIHGDLRYKNAALDSQSGGPLIFNPASFYGHNEYELGNWRQERNGFPTAYFHAYHSHVPKSPPEEDYDERNALYAMMFDIQANAMLPGLIRRESIIEEMNRLISKYQEGYEGYEQKLLV